MKAPDASDRAGVFGLDLAPACLEIITVNVIFSDMAYYKRSIEAGVAAALGVMPAVFLNGPRQAGKSTLVQHLSRSGLHADYVTFDDISTYASASQDPAGFLRRAPTPVIIDEVQRVPEIFRVLKQAIDERRATDKAGANGQFLLTGSANIMALPELADALVGRMAILSLYPLSTGEALGRPWPVINGWFDQEIRSGKSARKEGRQLPLDEIVARATFPEISGAPRSDSTLWLDGYLTALLQRDVRQLAEVEKMPALPNIVKILAARAGGLLNDADCARDAKLNPMTYRRYRILLQQLFLIALVPPWYRNIGKRLVKSPKLYFIDTALLCHQLGIDLAGLREQDPHAFGHVFENFVATELVKQLSMMSDGTLYHFRTHDGSEVDFVIERRNGKMLGIEVKARETIRTEDFDGLRALKAHAGKDFVRGIVLYRGKTVLPFGDDMIAMPLEQLWEFNMDIKPENDVHYSPNLGQPRGTFFFWADYGDRTQVRCLVPRRIIDDYFHDGASQAQAISAIRKHWDTIWPPLAQKIAKGRIEIIRHDHGAHVIGEKHQTIPQVTLEAQDFGSKDFRK
jgi:hypothetical protein